MISSAITLSYCDCLFRWDVGYRISDKTLFRYPLSWRTPLSQSDIGSSDIRLSPIPLITDILLGVLHSGPFPLKAASWLHLHNSHTATLNKYLLYIGSSWSNTVTINCILIWLYNTKFIYMDPFLGLNLQLEARGPWQILEVFLLPRSLYEQPFFMGLTYWQSYFDFNIGNVFIVIFSLIAPFWRGLVTKSVCQIDTQINRSGLN